MWEVHEVQQLAAVEPGADFGMWEGLLSSLLSKSVSGGTDDG